MVGNDTIIGVAALMTGVSVASSSDLTLRRWGLTLAVAAGLLACAATVPDRLTTAGNNPCVAMNSICRHSAATQSPSEQNQYHAVGDSLWGSPAGDLREHAVH